MATLPDTLLASPVELRRWSTTDVPAVVAAIHVSYWVRSDRHGRAYATAAARCLTDAAFRHLPRAERVEIRMDQANVASARVPAKLGYVLDGARDS